jgi:pSer/pThr/pTyr-binding forkhead associated (FHA) protein
MLTSAAARLPLDRFALEYSGRTHAVHRFPFVIGRGTDCDLVVPSGTVSRRHAALVRGDGMLIVEDLGSCNGVLVNARQVRGRTELRAGDTLTLGVESIGVVATRDTLRSLGAPYEGDPLAMTETTQPVESFELIVSAVDKALLTQRIDDAERLFALHLGRPLERPTQRAEPPSEMLETIGLLALRIAEASRNEAWVDFVLRVFSGRVQPMPVALMSRLCALVPRFGGMDGKLLRAYVAALDSRSTKLGGEQRFVLERLKGLEVVARSVRRRDSPPPVKSPRTRGVG